MQQSCKRDTTVTNRGIIQDCVRYSVGREIIKGNLQIVQLVTVQFTPAHDKESRVQKTEMKIGLPGRAVQNTEVEDRVSSLCVVNL
jgi:hypothetical protein